MAVIWNKAAVICTLIVILLVGCGCGRPAAAPGETLMLEQTESVSLEDSAPETNALSVIVVHICGEVVSPGVYELPSGSRLADAVEAAGGFTEAAAGSYRNLAAYVQDGEKIVIPSLTEVTEDCLGQMSQAEEKDGLVNINTASLEQLMTLPGIGQAKAEAILAYRQAEGCFYAAEDIMQVSGIKAAAFEKIKNYITVGP